MTVNILPLSTFRVTSEPFQLFIRDANDGLRLLICFDLGN